MSRQRRHDLRNVRGLCSISEQTVYDWERRYGEMGTSCVKRLRGLEDKKVRLERLPAEHDLEMEEVRDVRPERPATRPARAAGETHLRSFVEGRDRDRSKASRRSEPDSISEASPDARMTVARWRPRSSGFLPTRMQNSTVRTFATAGTTKMRRRKSNVSSLDDRTVD